MQPGPKNSLLSQLGILAEGPGEVKPRPCGPSYHATGEPST